jgi:hypothetical protein
MNRDAHPISFLVTQPRIGTERPQFKHDCPHCEFLGSFDRHDLYFCEQVSQPTVIARYSSYGPDYSSGLHGVDVDNCLAEAKRRAIARGLLADKAKAPRIRQLDVRDDHVQTLLIAMTDHLIRQRQLKVDPTLAEVEMLGVLTDMVSA